MRELSAGERISPHVAALTQEMTGNGWYCETTDARHTWPRNELYADHASGARVLVVAAWRAKTGINGWSYKTWPIRKHKFWASPPSPVRGRNSPWFRLVTMDDMVTFVVSLTVPDGLFPHGWPPGHGTACRCEKLMLHGEQKAAEALARAMQARAAGVERRRECRYYQCPDDALTFHLTSIPEYIIPAQRR